MARILMVTWDGGGNVPPMLRTGAALRERNHEVRVLGHEAQRTGIEGAGFPFVAYRHALAWDRTTERGPADIFENFLDPGAGRDVEELLAAFDPDAVVVDCLMVGALEAAIASGRPTATLVHSFYGFFRGMVEFSPMAAMGAAAGRVPAELWDAADEVLVTTDRELDITGGAVPANVHWVGVAQPRVAGAAPRADRRRVLLSLSTVWFPGQQESMQRVLDALGGLPVDVTATMAESLDLARLDVPGNVEVRPVTPHTELMPQVALHIGHGGHASTMLALAHGLPVLVVPQHPDMDQPIIGQVLQAHGAGRAVDQLPDVEELRSAVMELLAADGPQAIGARLREIDGAAVAAGRIEALACVAA